MIHVRCHCGQRVEYNNPSAGAAVKCPGCRAILRPVTGNLLPLDGNERFDARMTITAGPQRVGEQVMLAGAGPIELGKLPGKAIFLPGTQVSRNHCRLGRTVIGWQIQDTQSTNGIFVNGAKAQQTVLKDGDRVRVGDYEFAFAALDPDEADGATRPAVAATVKSAKAPAAAVAAPGRRVGSAPPPPPPPPMPAIKPAGTVSAPRTVARTPAPRVDDDADALTLKPHDSGDALSLADDDGPSVATAPPPPPPPRQAPAGRSSSTRPPPPPPPSRSAPPPIEHADVPAEDSDEPFDLYDLADDASKKVADAEAEQPIMTPPPVARATAANAPAHPGLGGGGLRSTPSGTVMTPGARQLGYAAPVDTGQRLLGDADIDWVMKLRNASTLMVWTINVRFIAAWFLPDIDAINGSVELLLALMNVGAAWLLTFREPEVEEPIFWGVVRIALRTLASITFIGEASVAIERFADDNPLGTGGLLLAGGTIPATALFLLYLWKLAMRIPNKPLAVNVLIVMIGLPVVMVGTVGSMLFAGLSGSPMMAIFAGIAGVILLIVFRIWYLILLIWFNRSFS